jgi:hypothetical protein
MDGKGSANDRPLWAERVGELLNRHRLQHAVGGHLEESETRSWRDAAIADFARPESKSPHFSGGLVKR